MEASSGQPFLCAAFWCSFLLSAFRVAAVWRSTLAKVTSVAGGAALSELVIDANAPARLGPAARFLLQLVQFVPQLLVSGDGPGSI